MDVIEVWTNCADRAEARRIGDALVEERLVASANVYAEIESRYHWKGEVVAATEVPLLLKTTAALGDAVEARIRAPHSYETPAILRRRVDEVNDDYSAWIFAETTEALREH
ncbi:MAG: divalent-cation tolerance protein CutA [Pseudomonadota bacterium]